MMLLQANTIAHQKKKHIHRAFSMAMRNDHVHLLPKDVWWLIISKLTLPDHIPFGGVCKFWRSIVSEYTRINVPIQVPALVIPGNPNITTTTTCQTRQFLLPKPLGKSINKDCGNLPLLSIPHRHLCRGSYQGWLVLVTDSTDMYLYNPLIGARIELPPASSLPNPLDHHMSKWHIHKAVLSGSPSKSRASDCFVLVFYGSNEIAFCKVGNLCWKSVVGPGPLVYIDGIFNVGKFYILDISGRVYASDLTNTDEEAIPEELAITPPVNTCRLQKRYCVELGGEFLQITREVVISRNIEEEVAAGEASELVDYDKNIYSDGFEFDYDNIFLSNARNLTYKTAMFQVFKLDMSGPEARWIQVEDLKGGAVFIGTNQSFALPSSNIMGYEGDRIYYTDDSTDAQKLSLRSGKDMGVFRLEDSSFSPLYLINSESVKPHPIWITPMP